LCYIFVHPRFCAWRRSWQSNLGKPCMNDAHLPQLGPAEQARLDRLRRILDQAGAEYAILVHAQAVDSAEDGLAQGFGSLAVMAPTFLLSSDRGWLVATISGATRLAYKKLRRQLGLKDVALASPETVLQVTGAAVGTMSLVNPGLPALVDAHLATMDAVFGGCGVPHHTLRIRVRDLIAVTHAQVFDFTVPKGVG
jgi:prolyl-tRNA editing enzyme YbaK/EbsC (Cys-tRNA(Pro) deacylase)